jgi:putative aldouronate transport system substrate-binding protein
LKSLKKEENEMFKRIITILVLAMAMVSLFGCGTATKEAATAKPGETKAAVPTEKGPVYTLDFYIEGNGDSTSREAVEAAINKHIEPLINANIKIHVIAWGDWNGKAITALEAGEKIDITFIADWNGYSKVVSEGLLTKLNDPSGANGDLLAQYGQDISSSLNPAFIAGSQINGINYAVPTNKELCVPWGFVYNETIADEIGMTAADAAAIKTPADMEPWLALAKAAHPDMAVYDTDGTIGWLQWVHGFSNISDLAMSMSAIPDANGKFDETILDPMETPWMADYVATMRDWYQKGYIPQDAGLSTYNMMDPLNAGNFFIAPQPLKGNNIKATELMIASGNDALKLKEIYGQPKVVNTSDTGGSMMAIPVSSKDPVTAMKFINLMHSDGELLDLMLFGVPDTMWTVDPDGRVNVVDDSWYKAIGGAWQLGDVSLQKVTNKEDPDKAALLIDYSKDALMHPSLGFRWNPDPVAAEITAVQSVVDGGQRALTTGYVDPTTALPKFIADLKAAGLDKIIAECQKQYAAWKTAKGG